MGVVFFRIKASTFRHRGFFFIEVLLILLNVSIAVTKNVKITKFQAIRETLATKKMVSRNRYLTKKVVRSLYFPKIFNLLTCLGIKKIIRSIKIKQKG